MTGSAAGPSSRPPARRRIPGALALALVVAAAAASVVGCSGGATTSGPPAGGPTRPGGEHAGAHAAAASTRPVDGSANADLVARGGQFAISCRFSHRAPDDPIVHPGHPGRSHLHDFFGNVSTDASSTARTLARAGTTCGKVQDRAAYWVPALLRGGRPVDPTAADAYYRVAAGVDARSVRPYPYGLKMLAGDAMATSPQPRSVVAWGCGRRPDVSAAPPTCPRGAPLDLRVTFPDCWDGEHLDSADHVSHVAYSGRSGCPASHPVAMPQLTLVAHFPVSGPPPADLDLAPGSLLGGHADFLNAWEPAALAREVRSCLRRGIVCSIPGGTFGVSKLS